MTKIPRSVPELKPETRWLDELISVTEIPGRKLKWFSCRGRTVLRQEPAPGFDPANLRVILRLCSQKGPTTILKFLEKGDSLPTLRMPNAPSLVQQVRYPGTELVFRYNLYCIYVKIGTTKKIIYPTKQLHLKQTDISHRCYGTLKEKSGFSFISHLFRCEADEDINNHFAPIYQNSGFKSSSILPLKPCSPSHSRGVLKSSHHLSSRARPYDP